MPGRLVAAVALLVLAVMPASALDVPYLAGRVTDAANIVPPDVEVRVDAALREFETGTGAQVVVLTIPSLEGEPIEDFATRVFQTWGIGRKGEDDGVLFLVVPDDRQMRIEVGYGLEGELTDLEASRILDGAVRPRFQHGDIGGGIEAGVAAIVGDLRGVPGSVPEVPRGTPAGVAERAVGGGVGLIVFVVFALASIATSGCAGWFLYVFLMPFLLGIGEALFGPPGGIVLVGIWAVLFPLLRVILRRSTRLQRWQRRRGFFGTGMPGGGGWSSGGGGWSSGGGSSGGGGFSGGGGMSGGGGASGRW